jgi:periplasmic divalent cation tolerance protein
MPPDENDVMPPNQSGSDLPSGRLVEIRTTCPSREAAESLATRLVQARLAACVQVDGPVRSTYEWRGAVETADEWRCTCKTTAASAAACAEAIAAGHPYETPEIITAPIEASESYAAWVRSSLSGTPGAGG